MASNENSRHQIQLIVDGVDKVTDTDVDYNFSRDKYKELLDIGMEILPSLKDLAMEAEHPRAYEVAFNALRQLADINDKLLNMHRKKQVIDDAKPATPGEAASTWGNEGMDGEIPYKGTTAALLAAMQSLRDQKAEDADFTEVPNKDDPKGDD